MLMIHKVAKNTISKQRSTGIIPRIVRSFFLLLVTLYSLSSCSKSFRPLDHHAFNERIASRTDIANPEALIRLYYDWPENEHVARLSIQTDSLGGNSFRITLIHEGLHDDSQSAEKIVMYATHAGSTWNVTEIKMNWKCWQGRGHTGWGTGRCT